MAFYLPKTWKWLRLIISGSARELVRYIIVGLSLNTTGYLIYLLVTSFGVSPLATVSIFYPLSVIAGYFSHRRHTFRTKTRGLEGPTLIRYIAVYVAGYLINAGLLELFYEKMGYPHQLVQILAIFLVAGFLFVAMKLFVFTQPVKAAVTS